MKKLWADTLSNSGLQPKAVQGMLDFDFICNRKRPSVAGIIYTFGGQFVSKMYVGIKGGEMWAIY
jgi:hypothetical protein